MVIEYFFMLTKREFRGYAKLWISSRVSQKCPSMNISLRPHGADMSWMKYLATVHGTEIAS